MTGCGSSGSGTLVVPKELPPVLKLRGYVDLRNIKFPASICGNNDYKFRDLSVFSLRVQDHTATTYVSANGEFSFAEMPSREQVVVFCTNVDTPNLVFEWMAASTSGLSGEITGTIDVYSTARSLIARTLRDRHGKRVNPEAIAYEYIETTVEAIVTLIEKTPDLLNDKKLSEVDSVKVAYTAMADSLAANSGIYPNEKVFLFYFAGDNDLAKHMEKSIANIAKAGQPEKTQIIIGLDTVRSLPILNKPGAATYRIVGNEILLLEELGAIDSTDTNYLEKFISFSMREYPSKAYSLIVSSHGGGWRDRPKNSSLRAQFLSDYSALATGTVLDVSIAIERAFNELNLYNPKFDMIVLDSCNMGCIETAYQLSHLAKYTVFSEALMPGAGIPYEDFFKEISSKGVGKLSSVEMAKIICEKFSTKYVDNPVSIDTGITLVNNVAMPEFMRDCNAYLSAVLNKSDTYASLIYNIRNGKTTNNGEEVSGYVIENFSPLNEFVDFKQLLESSHEVLLDVKLESAALIADFSSLILYSKYSSSLKNANGISITFPEKEIYQNFYKGILPAEEYFKLKFNTETKWNVLLDKMLVN